MKKNWLQLNLSALLRGKVEFLTFRKKERFGATLSDEVAEDYRPGRYYLSTHQRWSGPIYSPAALLNVLEDLSAIISVNAPLAQGLEICAREEQRKYPTLYDRKKQWQRTGLVFMIFFVAVLIDALLYLSYSHWNGPPVSVCVLVVIGLTYGLRWHRQRYEALYLHIRDDLLKGEPLSESMRRLRSFFPRFCADMVKAGEESGNLHGSLRQITSKTISAIDNRNALQSNLVYFFSVITANTGIMLFVLYWVVPVFQEILEEVGITEISWPMQLIFTLSQYRLPFDEKIIFVLLLASVMTSGTTGGILWYANRRNNFLFYWFGVVALYIPFLRGIFIQQNLMRIATMMKHYLAVELPLDRALDLLQDTEINYLYKRALKRVHEKIMQGESLTDALVDTSQKYPISKSFCSMVALGERSGMLKESFEQISDLYYAALRKKLAFFTEMLGPICILLYGVFIGVFVVGMFSILTSVATGLLDSM